MSVSFPVKLGHKHNNDSKNRSSENLFIYFTLQFVHADTFFSLTLRNRAGLAKPSV